MQASSREIICQDHFSTVMVPHLYATSGKVQNQHFSLDEILRAKTKKKKSVASKN